MRSIVGQSLEEFSLALNSIEASLPPGGQATIELCSYAMPSRQDLEVLRAGLMLTGFHASNLSTDIRGGGIPTTSFVLSKGSPVWAALIPILPMTIVAGLITFGIIRIETITKSLMPIILTVVGGAAMIAALLPPLPKS